MRKDAAIDALIDLLKLHKANTAPTSTGGQTPSPTSTGQTLSPTSTKQMPSPALVG